MLVGSVLLVLAFFLATTSSRGGATAATPPMGDPGAVTGEEPARSAQFFDPQRLSYEPDFHPQDVQELLARWGSSLQDVRFLVGDRSHSFAELLIGQTTLYSLNPKIILALLEQQSNLLSTPHPSEEQMLLAAGFAERPGLRSQVHWATITLRHALRDYAVASSSGAALPSLVFADGSQQAVAPDSTLSRYVLSRVLAPTTTPEQLDAALSQFVRVYTRLFDDPREPLANLPPLAHPFLRMPMETPTRITSFFDHDTPMLHENGEVHSYWGWSDALLSYDGHTGWDYALRPPDVVLAAATGRVMFVGNSDDGCHTPSRSVILDHGNGYRTLYWHLHTIDEGVVLGEQVAQGAPLGIAGESGCAFGPHLHFQVQYLGRDVDPYGWCSDSPDPWAHNPAGQESVWLWEDMLSPCDQAPPGVLVVDSDTDGFACTGGWEQAPLGYDGAAFFAASLLGADDGETQRPWRVRSLTRPDVAVWRPAITQTGRYRVRAYIPYYLNGLDDSRAVWYSVVHSAGETTLRVDSEAVANGWADLGTYRFAPGVPALVRLSTLAGDAGRGVWADAVVWEPQE